MKSATAKRKMMERCTNEEEEDEQEEEEDETETALLWDAGALMHAHARKRTLLAVLIAVSFCALLVAISCLLAWEDIGWVWHDGNYHNTILISGLTFCIAFLFGCTISPLILRYFCRAWMLMLILGCIAGALYNSAWFSPGKYAPPAAAGVCGFIMGPFYVAQNTYVTFLARRYHSLTGPGSPEAALCLFHGIYHALLLSAPLWRYLLSYIILSPSWETNQNMINQSECQNLDVIMTNSSLYRSTSPKNTHLIAALLGTYFGLSLLGILVAVLGLRSRVQPLSNSEYSKDDCHRMCRHLCDMARVLGDVKLLLIVPLCVLIGMEQAILYGTFIKLYVGCLLADAWVMWASACTAGTSALVSFPLAWISPHVGRVKLIILNSILQGTLCGGLILWPSSRSQPHYYLVFSILWGITDSVWQTQTNVFIGLLTQNHREAAFSNFRFWQMVGVLGVSLQQEFCAPDVAVYTLVAILLAALLCYVALEVLVKVEGEEKKKAAEGSICLPQIDNATWLPALSPHAHGRREMLGSRIAGTKEDAILSQSQ